VAHWNDIISRNAFTRVTLDLGSLSCSMINDTSFRIMCDTFIVSPTLTTRMQPSWLTESYPQLKIFGEICSSGIFFAIAALMS
jgi:hypothetical protein